MADFVAAERTSGLQYLQDLQATVRATWVRCCERDGVDPDAKFVRFSTDNPIIPFYNKLVMEYYEARAAFKSLGYVGLRIGERKAELHKRKGRTK